MSTPVWSVPLPADAERPIDVYVNGLRVDEGVAYTIEGRWLRFTMPLRPQPQLGGWRRVMLAMGIGVYGDLKGDVIDVSYRTGGAATLQSGLPIIGPHDTRQTNAHSAGNET